MERIISNIFNSTGKLVMSESMLCDDRSNLIIKIPTIHNTDEFFNFNFKSSDNIHLPKIEVQETYGGYDIHCEMGKKEGGKVGTMHGVDVIIAGANYQLFFLVTRLLKQMLRVEMSLYQVGSNE
jgi:hypothetical protein